MRESVCNGDIVLGIFQMFSCHGKCVATADGLTLVLRLPLARAGGEGCRLCCKINHSKEYNGKS